MADRVSPEAEEEFREVFDRFDLDKDGYITADECESVLKNLGLNPERKMIEQKIKDADTDGNGSIDFDEFLRMMLVNRSQPRTSTDLRAAFRIFDKDGNGYISIDELREVMKNLGDNLTDSQLKEMLDEADTDKDGQVSYEEFVRLLEPGTPR